jgi:hypothetical protein
VDPSAWPRVRRRLASIDFLSRLVQDELLRHQDGLLERRVKLAGFRDAGKRLATFDFDFNKKMNRALVFERATGEGQAEGQEHRGRAARELRGQRKPAGRGVDARAGSRENVRLRHSCHPPPSAR